MNNLLKHLATHGVDADPTTVDANDPVVEERESTIPGARPMYWTLTTPVYQYLLDCRHGDSWVHFLAIPPMQRKATLRTLADSSKRRGVCRSIARIQATRRDLGLEHPGEGATHSDDEGEEISWDSDDEVEKVPAKTARKKARVATFQPATKAGKPTGRAIPIGK